MQYADGQSAIATIKPSGNSAFKKNGADQKVSPALYIDLIRNP
jgi:hypothetical protein